VWPQKESQRKKPFQKNSNGTTGETPTNGAKNRRNRTIGGKNTLPKQKQQKKKKKKTEGGEEEIREGGAKKPTGGNRW